MTSLYPISRFFTKKPPEKVNDEALECSLLLLLESGQNDAANQLLRMSNMLSSPDILRVGVEIAFREKNWNNVLFLVNKACEFGWKTPDLLILKGRCLLKLSEPENALVIFREADWIFSDEVTQLWILKCEASISRPQPLFFDP